VALGGALLQDAQPRGDAVDGGKVKWNGQHVAKPARELKPGDELDIAAGELRWTVIVRGLNSQRRPAPEARLLYEETAESVARRQRPGGNAPARPDARRRTSRGGRPRRRGG
jgi:ribosome-associated heat shock protein Hsp15